MATSVPVPPSYSLIHQDLDVHGLMVLLDTGQATIGQFVLFLENSELLFDLESKQPQESGPSFEQFSITTVGDMRYATGYGNHDAVRRFMTHFLNVKPTEAYLWFDDGHDSRHVSWGDAFWLIAIGICAGVGALMLRPLLKK